MAHLHESRQGGLSSVPVNATPEVPGPKWLRQVMGDAYFIQVVGVDYTDYAGVSRRVDLTALPILDETSYVVLRGCRVSQAALRQLGQLRHISDLDLSWTQIDDEGLENLQNLRSLEILDLSHTPITDDGLKWLRNLNRLEYLAIGDTSVTDIGLQYLAELRQLADLELGGTEVTGSGLDRLPVSLTRLVLERSAVNDVGLAGLRRLVQLRQLILYDTRVTNGVFGYLEPLKKLSTLDVSWTFVTEDFVRVATERRNGIEVFFGPRLPDEDVLAIENVVRTGATATKEILRFGRNDANQVEVIAATREGQLNGYADRFTLVKLNGHWDIVSESHVDR